MRVRKDSKHRRSAPRRRGLRAEWLEPRLALAVFSFSAPDLNGPDAFTLRLNGDDLEIVDDATGDVWASQALANTDKVEIFGAAGEDDQLTIDFASGGSFRIEEGIHFDGGLLGFDTLRVIGGGAANGFYRPSGDTPGSGQIQVWSNIFFVDLEPVEVSGVAAFTFNTLNSSDDITIDSTSGSGGQPANIISGASDAVPFEPLTFFDIADFQVAVGDNDGANPNDVVRIVGDGLIAQGLERFRIFTGPGNDYVNGEADHFGFEVYGQSGNDTIIGGQGDDFLDGGPGDDFIDGRGGRDRIIAGSGNNILYGGDGDDTFSITEASTNIIEGGLGNDEVRMAGSAADDEIELFVSDTPKVNVFFNGNLTTLSTVETWSVFLNGGTDDVGIASLKNSDIKAVNISGTSTLGSIFFTGTELADDISITNIRTIPEKVRILGLGPEIQIEPHFNGQQELIVSALGGDDRITADDSAAALMQLTLDGGAGNDTITGRGLLVGGPGHDTLIGGGGGATTFEGGAGNDTFIPGTGNSIFNGGGGTDTILIQGTPGDDSITFYQTAANLISYRINGVNFLNRTVTDVELVRIEGDDGDDKVFISVAHGIANSLRFNVIGDAPYASDRLIVNDDGLGNLVLMREAADRTAGSITVGPLAPVTYSGMERVDILSLDPVTGGTGDDGLGRLVVFHADPFETNDSRLVATNIQAVANSLTKPVIDPGRQLIDDIFSDNLFVRGDEDWYEFRAPQVGTYRVRALFQEIGTLPNGEPGLPGNGALVIAVYDDEGNLIAEGDAIGGNQGQQVTFSTAAGKRYFVRVRGGPSEVTASEAINVYDLDFEQVDILGPQITAVTVPGYDYNLFQQKGASDALVATPPVWSIQIDFRDFIDRFTSERAPGDVYPALNPDTARQAGNYRLVGDATGVVTISGVDVYNPTPLAGALATATVTLYFAEPLPDDRFTLTVSDHILDPVGNALDGESNAEQPSGNPLFPTGDYVSGGPFVARFTIDSRPEIAVYSDGTVYPDINGNWVWDPTNVDAANRDFTFKLGTAIDILVAGKFHTPGQLNNGFDRIVAYGREGGVWRFVFADDHGRPVATYPSLAIDGMPFAGNFDGNKDNGDEVGVFDGATWWFDSNGNNFIDVADLRLTGNMRGYPIVGDFDGDGFDDLATWTGNQFQFDLYAVGGGLSGNIEFVLPFGFSGVLERPIVGDFNLDGIDDIGLWVPGRSGLGGSTGEWYILVSDRSERVVGTINAFDPVFTPAPLGNDIYARFGNSFALPLVGNFDPPPSATSAASTTPTLSGTVYQDKNGNGHADAGEALAGVDLQIIGSNGIFTTKTDAQGRYAIDVPLGSYRITASGAMLSAVFRFENISVSGVGTQVLLALNQTPPADPPATETTSPEPATSDPPATTDPPVVDNPYDVNGDGRVSSLDALVVINELNRAAAGAAAKTASIDPARYDVNRDGKVSPLDALQIINYLNARTQAVAAALPSVLSSGDDWGIAGAAQAHAAAAMPTSAAQSSAGQSSATASGTSKSSDSHKQGPLTAEELSALAFHLALQDAQGLSTSLLADVTTAQKKR